MDGYIFKGHCYATRISPRGQHMAQTERVLVLISVHDHRLNKPMVRDKSVMRRLTEQPVEEHAGRLSPDSAQPNRKSYFHASYSKSK